MSRQGRTFRIHNGAELKTDDQLGLFYTSEHDAYLTVYYLDQAGDAVRLFPARQPESALVQAGVATPLPDGARVNAGQGCEWIVGMMSSRPLADATARELVGGMWRTRSDCVLGAVSQPGVSIQSLEVYR